MNQIISVRERLPYVGVGSIARTDTCWRVTAVWEDGHRECEQFVSASRALIWLGHALETPSAVAVELWAVARDGTEQCLFSLCDDAHTFELQKVAAAR